MAGLVMGNMGQAFSNIGTNIGNLMFKSIGDEATLAARKEEWLAKLEDRQQAREDKADLMREITGMKLDAAGAKAGAGGKAGGINMEDIKPGGSQEVWAAAKLDMTVPEYTAFYNSLKTGDKSAFLQRVTGEAPAVPGMGAYQGQTSEQVSAQKTTEQIAPPPGFEAEYKAKMKKLADLQESYALGGHYDDVMKGRQQGFQTETGQGVLAGSIKPGPGGEAVGVSLGKERMKVEGGEKLNVFTGESSTTAVGKSQVQENQAQAGSASALATKYKKDIEKIDAEISGGMFNKNSNEKLNSIINSANATIKSLDESGQGSTPEAKADWKRQRDAAVAVRDKATKMQQDGLNARDEGTTKTKVEQPKTEVKMPEPKSPTELAKIKPGTRYKAPDGTIRIKG